MNYELATDEQLKIIIRYDIDLPTHLLSGLVTEMIKRDLFGGMILKAIKKRFSVLSIACRVLNTTREELFQVLHIEIWESVKKFVPGKSPFAFYMYLALVSKLRDWEKGFSFGRKAVLHHSVSTQEKVAENLRYEDCLTDGMNVERTVINRITFQEKLSVLTDYEKQTFLLYLKGYSFAEIGEMTSISKSGVNRRMKITLQKLSGRTINLKEFGNGNFKRGA